MNDVSVKLVVLWFGYFLPLMVEGQLTDNLCLTNEDVECAACLPGYAFNSDRTGCVECSLQVSNCGDCTFEADDTTVASCTQCLDSFYLSNGVCNACPSSCLTCVESGGTVSCQLCVDGFVPGGDGSCLSCSTQTTGCSKCTVLADGVTVSSCTECGTGFKLTAGTCQVEPTCPSSCITCETRDNGVVCLTCTEGYSLNGGECTSCTEPQRTCVFDAAGQETNTGCITGYSELPSTMCLECSSNCLLCDTDGLCNTCDVGYRNVDGLCRACAANCDSCADQIRCQTCSSGYIYSRVSQQCLACPEGCVSCLLIDNIPSCDSCIVGYTEFFDNTTIVCDACPANCDICDSPVNCTSCRDRFFNDGLDCVECPTGCGNCQFDTSGTIICSPSSCLSGYTFDTTVEQCTACPSNCITCSFDISGNHQCSVCDANFAVSAGRCRGCPPGCTVCEWFDNTNAICSLCSVGFAFNAETQLCVGCPENCIDCTVDTVTSETSCNECEGLFGFDSDGRCRACPANCAFCGMSSSGDGFVCNECDIGFKFSSGCQVCPPRCATCEFDVLAGTVDCSSCKSGFARRQLGTNPYRCALCSTYVENCAVCTDFVSGDGKCTECETGYELSIDGTKCIDVSCSTNGLPTCHTCAVAQCTPCAAGEVLSEDGLSCIPACYTCGGDDGGYLSASECGQNASVTSYELEECEDGSCWVYLSYQNNVTRYRRGCSTETCTTAYKYRVCTLKSEEELDEEELDTYPMECSRCCTSAGCNGFNLEKIAFNGSRLTHHSSQCQIITLIMVLFAIAVW